ncbi:MAG: AAA family ATPase, partial [Pseudonocardia sp.]
MRPIRLDMHGFAAFREPTGVDFTGAEYFALVGPTGSGKSTVIDAMTFALYGSVPRWDDRRTVKLALSPTAIRGTVQLLFDVGSRRYVAARELRRSAAGEVTVRNARLERLLDPAAGPAGGTEPLATDSQVSKAVEELLGLPFEQFCVCVVLPQGDFAHFLHAKPADRQKTLTRILGLGVYETIAQRAGREGSTQRQRAELLADQLSGYTDATDAAVESAAGRERALAGLLDRVAAALPGLAAADERVTEAERAAQRLRAEAALLARVAPPEGLAAVAGRAAAATAGADAARRALAAAERADSEARELLAAAPDPGPLRQIRRDHAELAQLTAALPALVGTREQARDRVRLAERHTADAGAALDAARAAREAAVAARTQAGVEMQRLADERDRLAAIRIPADVVELTGRRRTAAEALAGARRVVADADAAAAAARDAVTEATRRLADARADHDELARADQAAALRAELVTGHECPVCARTVDRLPPPAGPSGLPAARAALRAAEDCLSARTEALAAADRAAGAARVALAGAERADSDVARRVGDADAGLRAARDPLVVLGAPAPDTADLADSWRALAAWAAAGAADRARRWAAAAEVAARTVEAGAEAERAVGTAEEAVRRRRHDETVARGAEHDAVGELTRARRRQAELTQALAGAVDDAEAAARLAERDTLAERARAADAGLRSARTALGEATRAAERVEDEVRRAWSELSVARDPVVGLGAPAHRGGPAPVHRETGSAVDDLLAAWSDLTGWARRERDERERGQPAADAAVAAARTARDGLERSLVAALAELDVTLPPDRPLVGAAPVAGGAPPPRAPGAAAPRRGRGSEAAPAAA